MKRPSLRLSLIFKSREEEVETCDYDHDVSLPSRPTSASSNTSNSARPSTTTPTTVKRNSLSTFLFSSTSSMSTNSNSSTESVLDEVKVRRKSSGLAFGLRKLSPIAAWFADEELQHLYTLQQDTPAFQDAKVIIASRKLKQDLVNNLISVRSDYIEKIRFCGCVDEFQRSAPGPEREEKGRKIVELFVGDGAKFQCHGIAPATVQRLRRGSHDALSTVSVQFLAQLVSNEDFCKAVELTMMNHRASANANAEEEVLTANTT